MKIRRRAFFTAALLIFTVLLSGCGSQGKIEWRVFPMLSSSNPWLPMDFNFNWDRIEISCTDGELYGRLSMGDYAPKGREADIESWQNPVAWGFVKDRNQEALPENTVKKAEVEFRIFKGEELLHKGKVRIRQKEANSVFYTYEVTLICPTLRMTAGGKEADGKNQIALIRQASGEK